MHWLMIIFAVIFAWALRSLDFPVEDSWQKRWGRSLFLFIFPPILLLMTAFAVIFMGSDGTMLGLHASWLSYVLCLLFNILAIAILLKLSYQGYISQREINQYSQELVAGKKARILETDFPYSAQIGFWNSQLVVSRGMLNILDRDSLEAVIAHEQAHCDRRDTFYFFWLGWLKVFSFWLPNTELLWEELLLLREMRADALAARKVDSLLLAESLLEIAKATIGSNYFKLDDRSFSVGLSCSLPRDRFTERIDALLSETVAIEDSSYWYLSWAIFAFSPLITVPFHY
ncbi:MAG: M48 family metalloprotease [Prochloraceae cyanobacterium]|nr:M48 family metalloprotease [Prochloraceae cyanobacterium]